MSRLNFRSATTGGYSRLNKLPKLNGAYPDPSKPYEVTDTLELTRYDQDNFGFVRLEVGADHITGRYFAAPFVDGTKPESKVLDEFSIGIKTRKIT